jgi:hypothetical protein
LAAEAPRILQLKITLRHIRPPIWRRVQVPDDFPLRRLHDVIQGVMGWLDYHLHEFEVGDRRYGQTEMAPEDIFDRLFDDRNIRLRQVVERGIKRFRYTYDFGDGWEHDILVEKEVERQQGVEYPIFVTGKRRCPPEDCGGPWGFDNFLEALADPSHPEHKELSEWYGEPFDPDDLELDKVEAMLIRIRGSRRKGPRRKATRT